MCGQPPVLDTHQALGRQCFGAQQISRVEQRQQARIRVRPILEQGDQQLAQRVTHLDGFGTQSGRVARRQPAIAPEAHRARVASRKRVQQAPLQRRVEAGDDPGQLAGYPVARAGRIVYLAVVDRTFRPLRIAVGTDRQRTTGQLQQAQEGSVGDHGRPVAQWIFWRAGTGATDLPLLVPYQPAFAVDGAGLMHVPLRENLARCAAPEAQDVAADIAALAVSDLHAKGTILFFIFHVMSKNRAAAGEGRSLRPDAGKRTRIVRQLQLVARKGGAGALAPRIPDQCCAHT